MSRVSDPHEQRESIFAVPVSTAVSRVLVPLALWHLSFCRVDQKIVSSEHNFLLAPALIAIAKQADMVDISHLHLSSEISAKHSVSYPNSADSWKKLLQKPETKHKNYNDVKQGFDLSVHRYIGVNQVQHQAQNHKPNDEVNQRHKTSLRLVPTESINRRWKSLDCCC
jgi:hypothetical protein